MATIHLSGIEVEPSVALPEKIAASEWKEEMEVALLAARQAGEVLLYIQHSGVPLDIEQKVGFQNILSPVTLADTQANEILCSVLHAQFPEYGILTEEAISDEGIQHAINHWKTAEMTWIIDPLDGTRAFTEKGKDYGIHIGLTHHGVPVLGLNYYPETETSFFAITGCGSYKQTGTTTPQQLKTPDLGGTILPIRNTNDKETADIYAELLQREITPTLLTELFSIVDSCGMRICLIAEGNRTLYVSRGIRGGLWDYCSGEVIIREAGGYISDMNGDPINYRSDTTRLDRGSIVSNNKELHAKVLRIQQKLTKPTIEPAKTFIGRK